MELLCSVIKNYSEHLNDMNYGIKGHIALNFPQNPPPHSEHTYPITHGKVPFTVISEFEY